jgi:2'-5' RNA ligase
MEQSTRTFAAIEIADEAKERIGRFITQLRAQPGARDLKWVDPRIMHITVRFFGDLDRKQLGKARDAVRSLDLAWDPPSLSFGAVGAFPNPRRPQVVWIGIEDPDGRLRELAATADRAIRVVGFGPADKPFVAHLTLARTRRGERAPDLSEIVGGLTPPSGPLTIRSITLFKSDLRPEVPLYTPPLRSPVLRRADHDDSGTRGAVGNRECRKADPSGMRNIGSIHASTRPAIRAGSIVSQGRRPSDG